jgi:hypothetical protein
LLAAGVTEVRRATTGLKLYSSAMVRTCSDIRSALGTSQMGVEELVDGRCIIGSAWEARGNELGFAQRILLNFAIGEVPFMIHLFVEG